MMSMLCALFVSVSLLLAMYSPKFIGLLFQYNVRNYEAVQHLEPRTPPNHLKPVMVRAHLHCTFCFCLSLYVIAGKTEQFFQRPSGRSVGESASCCYDADWGSRKAGN